MSDKEKKSKKKVIKAPEKSSGDRIHAILKGAVAGAPLVGGVASELLSMIFGPPLEKRSQQWREEVSEVINELVSNRGIAVEELQNNDQFVSVVANATQIATRNHQQEKIEALKNALLNSVISETIEESLQNLFLSYIDTLTVWHIKILRAFRNPQQTQQGGRYSSTSSSPSQVLLEIYPDLNGKRDFYDLIWKDLFSRGLVGLENLHVMMTPSGAYGKQTTKTGEMFIDFISTPKKGNDK